MGKRIIYSIDDKVFQFVKSKIEKSLEINSDGYYSKYEGGHFKIFRHCVLREEEKIMVFFHKTEENNYSKLESSYEFSREYSNILRELIYDYEDAQYTGWKEQHAEVESYIQSFENQ